MPDWLDDLITKESHVIVKKAQGDKVSELERKIQNAKTPEELDAIEKELQELEKSAGDDSEATDETAKPADKGEVSKPKPQPEQGAGDEAAGAKKNEIGDKQDEIETKLLNEIEKLNDQLGLNKIIDLNTTMNTM
jgi:hypothetical protein